MNLTNVESWRIPGLCYDVADGATLAAPPQDALASYYDTYYKRGATCVGGITEREKGRFLQKHAPPGRLLDVGCGDGAFVSEARRRGYLSLGIDPFTTPGIDWVGRGYDVVTMWNVLEHCADYADTLERARRVLAPGGTLIIEVPNAGCLEARWLGRRWPHLDVPFHLWHFDAAMLTTALDQAGFEVVKISRRSLLANSRWNYLRTTARALRMPQWIALPLLMLTRLNPFASNPTMRFVAKIKPWKQ